MRHWHGSFVDLPVGTILTPRPASEGCAGRMASDAILERHRPDGMLKRSEAVFSCGEPDDLDAAGAFCDHVFEVVPIGPVQTHDLAWMTLIDCLVSDGTTADDPGIADAARRYWEGEPSAETGLGASFHQRHDLKTA